MTIDNRKTSVNSKLNSTGVLTDHEIVIHLMVCEKINRIPKTSTEGFDPGSERTLAAWIRHASRTRKHFGASKVAKGVVMNRLRTLQFRTTVGNDG